MEQKPLFITTYALTRCLKEFGIRLGLDENFADITAQLHVQQSQILTNWSDFIATNCSRCSYTPGDCPFLNPPPERCVGSTPMEMLSAAALMIETRKLEKCPAFNAQ